jgi:hypothetical protein
LRSDAGDQCHNIAGADRCARELDTLLGVCTTLDGWLRGGRRPSNLRRDFMDRGRRCSLEALIA